MLISQVKESYYYFTQATGERCRALAYAGIAAAFVIRAGGHAVGYSLQVALLFFVLHLLVDMYVCFFCAIKDKAICQGVEKAYYAEHGKMPPSDHSFDYAKSNNTFSEIAFFLRPILVTIGYIGLSQNL